MNRNVLHTCTDDEDVGLTGITSGSHCDIKYSKSKELAGSNLDGTKNEVVDI